MDLVLDAADRHLLTPYVYPASWPEGEPCRQLLSLFVITNLGALALYLLFGTLSYYFIFDHRLKTHPQFLEVRAHPACAPAARRPGPPRPPPVGGRARWRLPVPWRPTPPLPLR